MRGAAAREALAAPSCVLAPVRVRRSRVLLCAPGARRGRQAERPNTMMMSEIAMPPTWLSNLLSGLCSVLPKAQLVCRFCADCRHRRAEVLQPTA
jgi:hypothetical protein